jgi:hypothetical protein
MRKRASRSAVGAELTHAIRSIDTSKDSTVAKRGKRVCSKVNKLLKILALQDRYLTELAKLVRHG